jgi:hypothetical protein
MSWIVEIQPQRLKNAFIILVYNRTSFAYAFTLLRRKRYSAAKLKTFYETAKCFERLFFIPAENGLTV